ncbi:MAG: NUDIX hydrolase [Candidatus Rokubacteria bacterium]|nr:NUDIX hydrolase [Candidatus Rokubacteria bacterium]
MTGPVTPSPAATLVLLRDRPAGGVETLLIQRHAKSKFAGGDYVFAGGKVETDDVPDDVEGFCTALTAAEAAARLGADTGPREALGFWVGAIREAFEEVGALLAYTASGDLARWGPEDRPRYAAHRAACHASNPAFFDMLRSERLALATDRLTYFAHWITPEESPIRFDTRFFAAAMPPGQDAEADGREITDVKWLTAEEAFAAMKRQEISLRLPTIKNLELLRAATSATALLSALGRREVTPIRPRLFMVDGRPVPVLPGDPRWY